MFATGRQLMDGISSMLEKAGLPAQVIGVPPLFDIVYAAGEISDYRGWLRADAEMSRRFNRRFRASGILKGESKFYVSLAHDATDVKRHSRLRCRRRSMPNSSKPGFPRNSRPAGTGKLGVPTRENADIYQRA